MPLPPFQNTVEQFSNQYQLKIHIRDRMLDLTSEVGELAKEILKTSNYGQRDFQPDTAWEDELGDVFFSLICLANGSNVNLLEALNSALDKYQARLNAHGEAGSGSD